MKEVLPHASQYEHDAHRTVSGNYEQSTRTAHLFSDAVATARLAGEYCDKAKRAIFYLDASQNPSPSLVICNQQPATAHADLVHAALGFVTEAVEFLEGVLALDSAQEGSPDYDKARVNLLEELGDIQWYAALAAHGLDITLEEAQQGNIAKLCKRYPEKFTTAEALNRDTDAEIQALEQASDTSQAESDKSKPTFPLHVQYDAEGTEREKFEALIAGTANQMHDRMVEARNKGHFDWENKDADMDIFYIGVRKNMQDGDWISVCNYAAMLQFHELQYGKKLNKGQFEPPKGNNIGTEILSDNHSRRIRELEEALGKLEDKCAMRIGHAMKDIRGWLNAYDKSLDRVENKVDVNGRAMNELALQVQRLRKAVLPEPNAVVSRGPGVLE